MIKGRILTSFVLFGFALCGPAGECRADESAQTVIPKEPDPAGLVVQLKFDGNADDSAGNNHGIEFGSPVYRDGVSGQAISFDGEDDYIVITDNDDQSPIEFGKGSFSIAFWLKSDFAGVSNSGVEECIICNGTDGTEFDNGGAGPGGKASGKRYVIKFKHNKFRFVVDDGSRHILVESASSNFATGNWVHITAVRGTTVHALRIYCDGQLASTTVDNTGDISSPGEPLFIGAKQREDAHAINPANTPMDNYFKGMLDDLRIYNYALSQSEIASIMGSSSIEASLPSAESLFNVARQYEQVEIYPEAKNIYQQIVEKYPDSPEAHKARLDIPKTQILLLFGSGQNEAAQTAIDKLIADFYGHSYLPEMLCGIAKEYQNSDEFERAIAIYQKVATYCPASDYAIMAQTNIVLSYISMGKISESRQALNKLFEEFQDSSDFPKAIYEVAEPYKKAGEYGQAESLYKTIIANYPNTIHAFKSQKKLTILYIETGRDAEAQQSFDKLVMEYSHHPDLPDALEYIAGKYEMTGRIPEAQNIYQKIAVDYPNLDVVIRTQMNLAIVYFEEGNDTAVEAVLDNLIADFNDHPALPPLISQMGEKYCRQAFQNEQEGLTAEAKDNFTMALNIWQKVIKEMPASTGTASAYYFSAVCYRYRHEYEKAIEYFQKVISDWPDYDYTAKAQYRIGNCYEGLRYTGALSESEANPLIEQSYKAAFENYPDSTIAPYAALKLGQMNFSKNRWAEAACYFELFLEKTTKSQQQINVLYHLGRAYEQMGESDLAKEVYRTCIELMDPTNSSIKTVKARLEKLEGTNK